MVMEQSNNNFTERFRLIFVPGGSWKSGLYCQEHLQHPEAIHVP